MQRLDGAHPQAGSLRPALLHWQGCCHQQPLSLQAWVGWLGPGGGVWLSWGGAMLAEHAAMTLRTKISRFAQSHNMLCMATASSGKGQSLRHCITVSGWRCAPEAATSIEQ